MTRLRINFGTDGPGTKNTGGDLLFWFLFLNAKVTLIMKQAILLSNTTITAICDRIPAFCRPLTLGFDRMQKLSFAVALVLSAADRRVLSMGCGIQSVLPVGSRKT